MQNNVKMNDLVAIVQSIQKDIKKLQSRETGIIFVEEQIVTVDPSTGVKTVIGDLSSEGGTGYGLQQWIGDVEPPPVPTSPIVVPQSGMFVISWDGGIYMDLPQAPDYAHMNLYGSNGTSSLLVGTLTLPNEVAVYSEAIYGEMWTFWLTSVDQNGNESTPSSSSTAMSVLAPDVSPLVEEALAAVETKANNALTASNAAQTAAGDAATAASNANTKALEAAGIANGKGKVLVQSTAPGAEDRNAQTLWIDTTGGANTPKRWTSGTTWTAVTDKAATDAAASAIAALDRANEAYSQSVLAAGVAGAAQTSANSKNRVWYLATPPAGTAHQTGDLWYNTAAGKGNQMATWNATTGAWVVVPMGAEALDNAVTDLIDAAKSQSDTAIVSANSKNAVWHSTTAPTGTAHKTGDIWFDTANGNRINKWSGSAWVAATLGSASLAQSITDSITTAQSTATSAQTAAGNAATAASNANTKALEAVGIANGKGKVLIQSAAPGAEDRNNLTLWIDTTGNANTPKKWTTGTTWVAVTDKATTDAAAAAAAAQTTANTAFNTATAAATAAGNAQTSANAKNRVWYQADEPTGTGHNTGDTWFDTDDGNKISRWSGSAWIATAIGTSALGTDVTGPISAAQAAAAAAQTKADTAFTNAATAQTKANTAFADAATAAGIANGKGKTLIQSTAPGVDDRNAVTLWIDTTGGANTPKKWVSGTTWTAVTDKAATDAAAAAATAATSAATAQTAANNAATAAATAQSAAGTAQSRADSAYTMAGTKSNVFYSTAVATGTGDRTDDIWRQRDANNQVIGEWRWTGTAWQKITLTSGVFSNLDAGLLTAGTVDADRLNAGDIRAKFLAAGKITANDMIAGTITAASGIIGSIDLGKATVGTLDGARVTAGTLLAKSFAVTDFSNYMPNMLGQADDWDLTGGATIISSTTSPDGKRFSFTAGSPAAIAVSSYYMDVRPGEKFFLSYVPQSTSAASVIELYWQSNSPVGSGVIDTSVTTTSTNTVARTKEFTVPASTNKIRFGLRTRTTNTAVVYGNTFIAQRMTGSTLIEEGAISTRELATNSITAESGIIASLDLGKATVGELDGKYIKGGTVLAKSLAVTDFTNYLPNLTTQGDDWTLTGGATIVTSTLSAEKKRLSFPITALAQALSPAVGVTVNEKIKIQLDTFGTTATNNLELCWFGYDGNGTAVGSSVLKKTSTSVESISMVWTVPANVATVRFSVRVPAGTPANTVTTGAYNFTARKMTGAVLIEDGAIKANSAIIENGAIGYAKIGSLDLGVATVNTLSGTKITAKTLSVDTLLVTSLDNIVPDPLFTNNADDWGAPSSSWRYTATGSRDNGPAVELVSTAGGQIGKYSRRINVPEFASYRVSVWVKSSVAAPRGSLNIYVNRTLQGSPTAGGAVTIGSHVDATGTTYVGNPALAADTWYKMEGVYTTPVNVATIAIGVYKQTSLTGASVVTYSELVATRMSDADLIVDGTVTTKHLKADSIEAIHLKTNSVNADKILAGSIRTTHLAIGGGAEIVTNGSGELGNNLGMESFTRVTTDLPTDFLTGYRSTAGQNTTSIQTGDNQLRVKPNTNYKVGVWVKANKAGSMIYLQPRTGGTNTTPNYPFEKKAVPTTWTYWEAQFLTNSTPGGTMYFQWFVNHSTGTVTDSIFSFTGFSVQEMTTGSLLVNGAIDGKTITGSLFQTSGTAKRGIKLDGTGTNNSLKAWDSTGTETFSLDGTTGALSMAGRFDSGTSGNILSISRPYVFNNDYKADLTFHLPAQSTSDSQDAFVPFTSGLSSSINMSSIATSTAEEVRTALQSIGGSGNKSSVSVYTYKQNSLYGSNDYVARTTIGASQQYDDPYNGNSKSSYIEFVSYGVSKTTTIAPNTYMNLTADSVLFVSNSVTMPTLRLTSTGDASETSTGHAFQIGLNTGLNVVMDNNELIALNGTTRSTYGIAGSSVSINGDITTNGSWIAYLDWAGKLGRAGMKISGTQSYFQVEGMWTTTSAANAYLNTSGSLYRSTSSLKNKLSVEDLSADRDDMILSLKARTWFDKMQSEQLADYIQSEADGEEAYNENLPYLRRIPGMVAEEVEAAGLTEFVQYGIEGEVEGLMYDRLGVALIPVVGRLRDRVVELERLVGLLLAQNPVTD